MPFAIPRVWRGPQNHHNGCYFCMINIVKYRKVKGRRALTYLSILSSIDCRGRRKVLTMSQVLQCSTFASERPQVRTRGRQVCFLPRAPSNLFTLLKLIQYSFALSMNISGSQTFSDRVPLVGFHRVPPRKHLHPEKLNLYNINRSKFWQTRSDANAA